MSGQTASVVSIEPVFDGFIFKPEGAGSGGYTVVYVQSSLPPSSKGSLIYSGRSYCYTEPFCFDENGETVFDYDSLQRDGALVPTPEPGTIGLVGLGLAGLAAKLRASRHRRVDQAR